jgi:hypothetical protein
MFDRDYLLTITTKDQTIEIKPPMRITFDATKTTAKGLNKCNLNIYNLKESTRMAMIKDPDGKEKIDFSLQVGHKGTLKSVFQGQVLRGESKREGVNYITRLEALDGGHDLYSTPVSKTVKGKDNVFRQLTENSETKVGVITQQSELTRPRVLCGNMIKCIDDLVEDGQSWYIDNGKLYITKENEAIDGLIPVASSASGLISTPTREKLIIEFESLINPSFILGELVKLESTTAKHLNGTHKIDEITYKGDIDGSEWRMTVKCKVGDYDRIK